MHLVYVPDSQNGTIYEMHTYSKARTFLKRHVTLGATMIGKTQPLDKLDLFAERVKFLGRKYNKKGVKHSEN